MVLQAEAKDALIAAEAATSCSDSQEKPGKQLRMLKCQHLIFFTSPVLPTICLGDFTVDKPCGVRED